MNNSKLGIPTVANPYLNPLYTVNNLINLGVDTTSTTYSTGLDYFLMTNQAQDSESVSLMIPLSNQINAVVTNPLDPGYIANINTIIITGAGDGQFGSPWVDIRLNGRTTNGIYNLSGYDNFGLPIYTGGSGNNFKFNFNYYYGDEGFNLQYKFTKSYWEVSQFKNIPNTIPSKWNEYVYHYRWEINQVQKSLDSYDFTHEWLDGEYGTGVWIGVGKDADTGLTSRIIKYENNNFNLSYYVLPQKEWGGIAYGTGRWVAMPKYDNNFLAYCQGDAKGATSINNGETWSEISINGQQIPGTPMSQFSKIGFNGNNRWVIIGRCSLCSAPTPPNTTGDVKSLMSTDGVNWSGGYNILPNIPEQQKDFKTLAYGNNLWITLNSYLSYPSQIGAYSTNGTGWSVFTLTGTPAIGGGWKDLHFATGRFIAMPQYGSKFATSTVGTGNWSYVTVPIVKVGSGRGYTDFAGITHNGKEWVVNFVYDATTGSTPVLKSIDGINWSGVYIRTDGNPRAKWNSIVSDNTGTSIVFGGGNRVLDSSENYYQNYPDPVIENFFPAYQQTDILPGGLTIETGNSEFASAQFAYPVPFISKYSGLQYAATEEWPKPCEYINGNVLIQSNLKEAYGTNNFASGLVNSTIGDIVNFTELNYGFKINEKNYSNSTWFITGSLYKYDYSNENLINYLSEFYSSPQITNVGSTYTFKFIQSPNNSGHKIQYRTGLNNGWTTTGIELSTSVDQSSVSNGNVRKEFYAYGPSATTGFYYRMRSYQFSPIYVGIFNSSGTTGNNNLIKINIQEGNNIYYISLSGSNYSLLDFGDKLTSNTLYN